MVSTVHDLAVDSSGNVYAGGQFSTAGTRVASHIAKWNGTSWLTVANPAVSDGVNGSIFTFARWQRGPVCGRDFTTAGGIVANHVVKWGGSSWSAMGGGTNARVEVLAVDAGGNLYAGGDFTAAGGVTVNRVAK